MPITTEIMQAYDLYKYLLQHGLTGSTLLKIPPYNSTWRAPRKHEWRTKNGWATEQRRANEQMSRTLYEPQESFAACQPHFTAIYVCRLGIAISSPAPLTRTTKQTEWKSPQCSVIVVLFIRKLQDQHTIRKLFSWLEVFEWTRLFVRCRH